MSLSIYLIIKHNNNFTYIYDFRASCTTFVRKCRPHLDRFSIHHSPRLRAPAWPLPYSARTTVPLANIRSHHVCANIVAVSSDDYLPHLSPNLVRTVGPLVFSV